ncbi:hypothetical protein JXA63_04930, partial [Candidatus Woesebacteria bacterium]|nr:hypothetical protein [Candidatus Woesebacteria bacterium]
MKVFKLLTALLVLFFICQIFDISVYAQEVCKWDGGHHVCWGDVGCTVGLSTCSAPACHCYADSSPDGLYCGRVANCGQHCDFCPGTEGQSNCCWLEYCECGCACGGCCDGGAVPLCDAITYDLPSPLDPNTDICVSISREEAVPCGFGNWDNVELLVGPAGGTLFSVALGLCECDGSNCGQGYQGHFNTGPEGDYTMQFTVRNGMCQCNTYDFTVGSPPPPPPPPNLPPTCDIQSCPPPYMTTGEIFNITANANDTDGTVTRTLIHSIDQTASLPVPLPWNLECEDFSGSCNTDISFASPGDYYITCNAFDDGGGKCSGNPWCEWFPNPPSGMTCATDPVDDGQSGWSDCGNYDVCWVSVAEPKTWDIETEAICTNGEANTCSTRSWYRIWPPSPMQTTYRALISPGLDSFSITSEQHNNNIYVGMKDTAWNDLDLLGFPPHPGITYGTFWVGAIPMARWARDGVPEGGPYRIEFEAPEACCVSCNVSLNNITLEVGETDQYVPLNMTTSGPVFDRVEYTVVDGGVAAICDSALASCSEGSVSFTAGDSGLFQLTGITQGNTTYSALGYLVDGTECSSDTANISVMNVPWWQVGFGDVVTNDDIVSYIPSGTSTCLLP